MLGHLAELATSELRADMLVMGIGAIGVEQGLMNDSVPEILTDRALRRMARSVVVLADATKFEQVAPGFVFGLEEVDVLVTDEAVAPATLDALRGRGVRVIVAGGDDGNGIGTARGGAAEGPGDRRRRPARDPREPGRHPGDRRVAARPARATSRTAGAARASGAST